MRAREGHKEPMIARDRGNSEPERAKKQARMIQRGEPGSARESEALACGKYIWLTLALSEAGLDIWQYEDKCYVWKFRELMTIMIIAMEKRRMEPSEAGLDIWQHEDNDNFVKMKIDAKYDLSHGKT